MIQEAAFFGALAAGALVLGALIVMWSEPPAHLIGLIMGFGAGALIASIAYALIPESVATGNWGVALAFVAGALVFLVLDWWIDRRGGENRKSIEGSKTGSGASIFLGTLLDGVPESLILGIGIAQGSAVNLAFIVAVFVSNIPEGMAGTLNLESAGLSKKTILLMWLGVVLVSTAGAALGYTLVKANPSADGRYAQAFAAGGLLTMLADAMMPEAFEHGGKLVGLLTVFGFLVAAILSVLE